MNHSKRTPKPVEDLTIHMRKTYHFGPDRIAMFLGRNHQIRISGSGARWVLVRYGMNRLPQNTRRHSPYPKVRLYEKQVPRHHIQVGIKFLTFVDKHKKKIKRYQHTAIDDAIRIRVLRNYDRHTQNNAIDFMKHVKKKLPFRIKMVSADNGHEFQARFHWHLLDSGINHVYLKRDHPNSIGR